MNPIFKKILYIAGFLSAIFVLGYLIYWTFFLPRGEVTNANVNVANANRLPNVNANANRPVTNLNVNAVLPNINGVIVSQPIPEVASGGATLVKTIVDKEAKTLTLSDNKNDLIYYDPLDGKFYKISPDGSTKTQLTGDSFPEAKDIYWAPSKDKAIISFPDDSKILYDFNQKKQYSLPKETTEFSFSPDSDKIAFKYLSETEDNSWLAVANPDGSEANIVEEMGTKASDVTVNWSPNNQVIATFKSPLNAEGQEIIFVGQHNENFKGAEVAGRGFEGIWSPDGGKMVYSVYGDLTNQSPTLWVMGAMGDNIGENNTPLAIPTWADKCTFSNIDNSNIYCAVPKYLPEGSGFYPELADSIPDDFYKINITTGLQTLLASPVNSSGSSIYTAENVYVSANEDFLYFTDKNTGKVNEIRLK